MKGSTDLRWRQLSWAILAVSAASEAHTQSRFRNTYDAVRVSSSYSVLSVVETVGGDFAASGGNGSGAFLLELDSSGATNFFKTYDIFSAPGLDEVGGGYVLAGERYSYNDPAILRVDGNGDPLWSKSYDVGYSEQGFYVAHPTPDGGYLLSGIMTVKVDGTGSVLWSKIHIGGGGNVNGTAITTDGGSVLTGEGQYGNTAGDYNAVVTRLDSGGNVVWNKVYAGDQYDWAAGVTETNDGGYAVTGWTRSFAGGAQACFLIKLDSTGALTWANTYAGTSRSECYSVRETRGGGYILTGNHDNVLLLLKTDDLGALSWARTYMGSNTGYSVRQTTDDGYLVAGISNSALTILKTDDTGDAATCDQLTPAITVAAAPFLTGNNTTAGPQTWTVTDLTPVATTPAPPSGRTCGGCTASAMAQISDVDICAGETVDLTATGSSNPACNVALEYRWRAAGFLRDWSTVPDATDTPTASNSYTLDVRCADPGCQTSSSPVAVTVHADPALDPSADRGICLGGTTTLGGSPTVLSGTPPYTYDWVAVPADPSMSCTMGATCSNPSVSPLVATTYTLNVVDGMGCAASAQITLTIAASPSADAGPDGAICVAESTTLGASPTASGGTPPYSYDWVALPPDASMSCTSGSLCANPTASPLTTTTYTVTVSDALGCAATSPITITVDVPAAPPDLGNTLFVVKGTPDPTDIVFSWPLAAGSAIENHLRSSDNRDFSPPNAIRTTLAVTTGTTLPAEIAPTPGPRLYRVTTGNCAGDESWF